MAKKVQKNQFFDTDMQLQLIMVCRHAIHVYTVECIIMDTNTIFVIEP